MDFRKKIKSYQGTLKRHGVGPKALQWTSTAAADLRYKELVADIEIEGMTILDVGCGFGDIIPYLAKKTDKFVFTGVDIVPEFVKVAIKNYPQHQFLVNNYFDNPIDKKFDVVMSSGALNSNIKNPYRYRKRAIKTMFDHAKKGLVFNMAGFSPQPKNREGSRVYYANSQKILKYCLSLSSRVIYRHHYHPKDFTIVMFK